METVLRIFSVGTVLLLFALPGQSGELPVWCRNWRNYFRNGFSAALLSGLPEGREVLEVRGMNGKVLGWMFRTDQIEPHVKGYKDQIAVKVALDREKKILGVAVVESKETPSYFQKITDKFFAQFRNRSLDAGSADIQTVTGATVSSRAIVRDVFESA